MKEEKKRSFWKPEVQINPPVFFSAAIITFLFVAMAVVWPVTTEKVFSAVQLWITDTVGWFYVLSVAFFAIFVVYLAASKTGLIKLGPDHSEPDYTKLSWFAILWRCRTSYALYGSTCNRRSNSRSCQGCYEYHVFSLGYTCLDYLCRRSFIVGLFCFPSQFTLSDSIVIVPAYG